MGIQKVRCALLTGAAAPLLLRVLQPDELAGAAGSQQIHGSRVLDAAHGAVACGGGRSGDVMVWMWALRDDAEAHAGGDGDARAAECGETPH